MSAVESGIRVSNTRMPGYRSRRTLTMGNEEQREEVFDPDGQYIGEVVYVKRRTKRGIEYGWMPAKAPRQSKITDRVEAIKRLPRFTQP